MKFRLAGPALAVATLLLGTVGCSKKEDPAAIPTPVKNKGSYTVDGVARTCQVTAWASSNYNTGALIYDHVELKLVTTPEPASGREILQLSYYRSSLTAPYQLTTIFFFTKNSLSLSGEFTSTAATLTPNSDGSYSGTFAGQGTGTGSSMPIDYKALTVGSFTNVFP